MTQTKLVTDFSNAGVIVARFQVPELHEGHLALINKVKQYHKKVIIFLGISSFPNENNPLDYQTRERMIKASYPDIIVAPLKNMEHDDIWAASLDEKIREIEPKNKIILYGSRDSFIKSYKPYGRFECIELMPEVDLSGTELRQEVCNEVRDTPDFRRAFIYQIHNSYPKVMSTVDILLYRQDEKGDVEILLGQKHAEMRSGKWRIPGGFIEKKHNGGVNAAIAETEEETGLKIQAKDLRFITQMNIDDWRVRGTKDCIMTTMFAVQIPTGWTDKGTNLAQAGDDLGAVKWFKASEVLDVIHNIHRPLIEAYFASSESAISFKKADAISV